MRSAEPSPAEQLRFLENYQTLLHEGQFTATYKFALLVALADLAVECGDIGGDPLEIPVRRIAEKFVQYYWSQAAPWPAAGRDVRSRVLAQNTGRPSEIVTRVAEVRETAPSYHVVLRRDAHDQSALVSRVARIVRTMPLWKLQTLRGRTLDFLYPNEGRGSSIVLRPGVAYNLRHFHPLVTGMARAKWADFVRGLKANHALLGQATDLHEFLFGAPRADLGAFRSLLRELQHGECFYCRKPVGRGGAVDHFVPWSRYPVDLGHNFVLADAACNGAKSDFLPALRFLERWARRNKDQGHELVAAFDGIAAPHDLATTTQIAAWAYGQVERAGGRVWALGKKFEALGPEWRGVFGG